MFIQKLALDKDKSYKTTTTLDNLVENLHLSFNHIPIITPYASKSESDDEIRKKTSVGKSSCRMSLTTFEKYAHLFDCTHFIVEEIDLFDKFGFDLKSVKKPYIYINEDDCNLPTLNLCKFSIKCMEDDAFVIIYILTNLFSTGTVVSKNVKKLKIFFKVFEINWGAISYDEVEKLSKIEDSSDNFGQCLVFLDGYVECNAERIFCLGSKASRFENLKIDLSLAGKYKYRINDVYKAITPAVIKGTKKFHYERFQDVTK